MSNSLLILSRAFLMSPIFRNGHWKCCGGRNLHRINSLQIDFPRACSLQTGNSLERKGWSLCSTSKRWRTIQILIMEIFKRNKSFILTWREASKSALLCNFSFPFNFYLTRIQEGVGLAARQNSGKFWLIKKDLHRPFPGSILIKKICIGPFQDHFHICKAWRKVAITINLMDNNLFSAYFSNTRRRVLQIGELHNAIFELVVQMFALKCVMSREEDVDWKGNSVER